MLRTVCVALLFSFPGTVFGQAAERIDGKVTSVETRGKTVKLTVSSDAGEQTFELTPKVELEIVSQADEACVVAGLFVKLDCIESNRNYFASTVSVYPEHAGRVPPATPVKAPKEEGQSQNRVFISGEVAEFTVTPDEKYDRLELKGPGKNTLGVYVERQRSIRVVQTEPSHLAEGQAVTVVARKAGTKLLPQRVTINTGQSIQGEEFIPTLKRKK